MDEMSAPPALEPPLELLCEDGPLLAVNKPAGLLTQGVPAGVPTLEAQVKAWLKQKHAKPGNVYLGIPHRLDRPVSGVIVFARNSKAAARLAEQFHDRRVRKVYWALVEGTPEPPAGRLDDWLLKIQDEARTELVPPDTPGARQAHLDYRTLGTTSHGTLLEIDLGTGRMHQIRAQLASRGWPIVGDAKYGGRTALPRPTTSDARFEQIALHARQLTLFHPIRYDELTLTAPVPSAWRELGTDVAACLERNLADATASQRDA